MAKVLRIEGDPPIAVHVRRTAGGSRLSLRVSSLDGRTTLSMPRSVPLRDGLDFIRDRADWLRAALSSQPARIEIAPGAVVPVAGRDRHIVTEPVPAPVLRDDTLAISPDSPGAVQVMRFLKRRAKCELERACAEFGARIDRYPRRISLRDTRSRWGSCTAAGNLMFSWRLAMAPPDVLEYVAAHEVAHLREMNHGAGFWALVAELTPDYGARRRWLQAHGPALHRYRFDAAEA